MDDLYSVLLIYQLQVTTGVDGFWKKFRKESKIKKSQTPAKKKRRIDKGCDWGRRCNQHRFFSTR